MRLASKSGGGFQFGLFLPCVSDQKLCFQYYNEVLVREGITLHRCVLLCLSMEYWCRQYILPPRWGGGIGHATDGDQWKYERSYRECNAYCDVQQHIDEFNRYYRVLRYTCWYLSTSTGMKHILQTTIIGVDQEGS